MLALLLAVAVVARPVDAPPPAKADALGEAELVAAAKKHFAQRQYTEAIAKFQAAYAVGHKTVRLYNIGKCYERLQATGKALRYFREYLRLEPLAKHDEVLKGEIASATRQLSAQGTQQLVIMVNPPTAEVVVDGLRQDSVPAYVELAPGAHRLVARAQGYQPEERSLTAPLPTGDTEVRFELHPSSAPADAPRAKPSASLTPATPSDSAPVDSAPVDSAPVDSAPVDSAATAETSADAVPRRRVWTWVSGGVAIAAGVTAAGMGAAYGAANQELHTLDTTRLTPQVTELERRTVGLATGTNVAVGVAVVSAATAVVLYFLELR